MDIKTMEEITALRGLLDRASGAHRGAVGDVVRAAGGLLAAAHDLWNKGTAEPVIEEAFDTFAAELDRLRAAVAVLNDRHLVVALVNETLSAARADQAGATLGGAL